MFIQDGKHARAEFPGNDPRTLGGSMIIPLGVSCFTQIYLDILGNM